MRNFAVQAIGCERKTEGRESSFREPGLYRMETAELNRCRCPLMAKYSSSPY